MAETKKLVTLDLLEYYDTNIKKWVINKISDIDLQENLKFFEDAGQFPLVGRPEILYITKDSIYQWDDTSKEYIKISTTTTPSVEQKLEWGKF